MTDRNKLIAGIMSNTDTMRKRLLMRSARINQKGGITHSQWFVLAIITNRRHVSLKKIAEMLCISPSAVTQLTKRLVDFGFVNRTINRKDRRTLQLSVTKKGRKQLAAMKEKRAKEMAAIFDVLSDKELEAYLSLTKKIASRLHSL